MAILDYNALQTLLDDNQYLMTVAELQGLLMGFYSAGLAVDGSSWKQPLMRQLSAVDAMVSAIEEPLCQLNISLTEKITRQIFGLDLLLPDDACSTQVRGEALGYWCQGFLLGYFQISETKDETDEDVVDALSDLEEIANIDLNSIGSTEADEKYLFELTEHIKVVTQLIHGTYGQRLQKVEESIH